MPYADSNQTAIKHPVPVLRMMTRWDVLWLAVGIALTTATQLRVGGGAIGPGEVMLALWILLAIARVLIIQHHPTSPVVKAISLFWMACYIALATGLMVASSLGIAASDNEIKHDVQALILASVFSMIFVISLTSIQQAKQGLADFTAFITISLGMLFFFPSILPMVSTRYFDVRFTGWSLNPNQTALSLLFVPFFSLYLLQECPNRLGKIGYGLLTMGAVFLGRATQSDALSFGWGVGLMLLIALAADHLVLNIFIDNHCALNRRRIYKALIRLLLFITAFVSLPILYHLSSSTAEKVYDYGGQGSDRVRLWKNGLIAFSHSPVFGLGPGSHSGSVAPFLGMECHNTFIDWATSTGLIGLMSYVALLGWIGWITWQKGFPILFAGVIASVGFVNFHYVARQPIYWFCLLTIAEIALLSSGQRRLSKQIPESGRDVKHVTLAPVLITEPVSDYSNKCH